MKTGNIKRAFTYLESGSVLLVTTSDGARDNVMTISWQMVMDFTPHIAITTGGWNESFETILEITKIPVSLLYGTGISSNKGVTLYSLIVLSMNVI